MLVPKPLPKPLKKQHTDSIDLGNTCIGNEGAKAIAQALEKNIMLTSMNIDFNYKIDDGSVKVIEQMLKYNASSSKHYLAILLEADHANQSQDKPTSFLKKLDHLLQYNLQKLPERLQRNLMEVIEGKLFILYETRNESLIMGANTGR